ncbi:MAG: hypothetical protein AAF228_02035 [Pseudomonadota bacterium]
MIQGIYTKVKRFCQRAAPTFIVCSVGLYIAGCSNTENFGVNFDLPSSTVSSSDTTGSTVKPVNAVQNSSAPVAFAPVFGPPVNVAQKLSGALRDKAKENRIIVQDKVAKSGYTVRGYLSASPDKKGTKLSYIWDVTNSQGTRAHRIKGEEIFPGKNNANDPWSAVNQAAIDKIASTTASKLAAWLPKSPSGTLVQNASLGARDSSPSANASFGSSKSRSGVIAVVPPISGAPGNGSTALAEALRKKISGKGIRIANSQSAAGKYKIQGIVSMSSGTNGKQNIKLEWKVVNPLGREIGTVTQQNSIPKGSLNGNWGATADYVADAASNGIVKLIKDNASS